MGWKGKEIERERKGIRNRLSLVRKSSPKNILKPKNSEDLPAITNDFLFHLLSLLPSVNLFSKKKIDRRKKREEKSGRGPGPNKTRKIKIIFLFSSFVFLLGPRPSRHKRLTPCDGTAFGHRFLPKETKSQCDNNYIFIAALCFLLVAM